MNFLFGILKDPSQTSEKTLMKIVAIICFFFITLSIVLLIFSPSESYEFSIYESTPLPIWILLISSIFLGLGLAIYSINDLQKNRISLLIAFSILLFSRFVLLNIPFFRGYFCWGGDTITHIAIALDILNTGGWTRNPYPITHIFSDQIVLITGIQLFPFINYMPSFFSLTYVIIIYLLSTTLFSEKKAVLISTFCAAAVILGSKINTLFYAFGFGYIYYFLFLLFLTKYLKTGDNRYGFLFILSSVIAPMIHATLSVLLCISFIIFVLGKIIFVYIDNRQNDQRRCIISFFEKTLFLLVIQLTIFFSWIFLGVQNLYNQNIRYVQTIVETLSLDNPETVRLITSAEKLSLSFYDIFSLIVKSAGADLFFSLFIITTFILLIRNRELLKKNEFLLSWFLLASFISILFIGFMVGVIPGAGAMNFQRIQMLIPLFCPIFLGFTLFEIISENRGIKILYVFIVICIFLSIIIGVIGVFQSPLIMRPNTQITVSDIHQFNWYLDSKSTEVREITITSDPWRIGGVTYGHKAITSRKDINQGYDTPMFPDHFNYQSFQYVGQNYGTDEYGIFRKIDKIIYSGLWGALGRFNTQDFDRLNYDKSADKLFDNGDGEIWYISSIKS